MYNCTNNKAVTQYVHKPNENIGYLLVYGRIIIPI